MFLESSMFAVLPPTDSQLTIFHPYSWTQKTKQKKHERPNTCFFFSSFSQRPNICWLLVWMLINWTKTENQDEKSKKNILKKLSVLHPFSLFRLVFFFSTLISTLLLPRRIQKIYLTYLVSVEREEERERDRETENLISGWRKKIIAIFGRQQRWDSGAWDPLRVNVF